MYIEKFNLPYIKTGAECCYIYTQLYIYIYIYIILLVV